MNIKYTQILTVSIFAVLIVGGSIKWWLASSQANVTTTQQSHPASRLNTPQGLGAPATKPVKQDRYQELESKLAKLEALFHSFSTANITNNKNEQAFVASAEDDGLDSDTIEQQIQAREDEVQRLTEQRAIYFAQVVEQHRMQEVDTQWASAIEQKMWTSFKQPGVDNTASINDIDCRTDMCIIEISQSASGAESSLEQGQDVFSWVSANAGVCEFAISEGPGGEGSEADVLQRVYLTNCRQSV